MSEVNRVHILSAGILQEPVELQGAINTIGEGGYVEHGDIGEVIEHIQAELKKDNPLADEVFIIGGGELYKQSLDLVDTVYLTIVDADIKDGDAFFPALDPEQWQEVWSEGHRPDKKNELAYRFSRWERR